MKIAFLHTAEVHTQRFESLARARSPDVETVHLVKPELLTMAQGATEVSGLKAAVRLSMAEAEATAPDFIVCTCSTIGQIAEEAASDVVPCIRIDRPMARIAVQQGNPIYILAALASTLLPTEALIRDEALAAGIEVQVESRLVEGAWTLFEAGNTKQYLLRIEQEIERVLGRAAVVVLAQASMAEAAKGFAPASRADGYCKKKKPPVLASTESGLDYVFNILLNSKDA